MVVNDILTVAPRLAEAHGCAWGTPIPHIYPVQGSRDALFGRWPAATNRIGRGFWSFTRTSPEVRAGTGTDDPNDQRARWSAFPDRPIPRGTSPRPASSGRYTRNSSTLALARFCPRHRAVPFETRTRHCFAGDEPADLVAPRHLAGSRQPSSDRLAALGDQPVRVVATTNRVVPSRPIQIPANSVAG